MTKSRRSRGGRPRKPGERYPGGKLKQITDPNPVVIANRKALLGALKVDLSVAEDPMALALAHGWLTEDQHRAGESYAASYRLSHPQRRQTGLSEAPEPASHDKRSIAQMGSAEIVAAFDSICAGTVMPAASETRQIEARRRYNTLSNLLTAPEQQEVFLCFVQRSWPQWIVWRAAGKDHPGWERKHALLSSGLNALSSHLSGRAKHGNATVMAGSKCCA